MGHGTKAEGDFLHRIVHRLFPGRQPEDLEARESRTQRCAFVRDSPSKPWTSCTCTSCTLQDTWSHKTQVQASGVP
jgi:hypothetical protein